MDGVPWQHIMRFHHRLLSPRILAAGVFSILLCAAAAQADVQVPDPDALDSILNRHVDEGHYPFIYARIEDEDGNLVYEHGAVNRNLIPDARINGDTWIRIWSMSKIVTITIVMDLVEDGLLRLDDPVIKYIPEFNKLQVAVGQDGRFPSQANSQDEKAAVCPLRLIPVESQMTIMHLITHEAGFYYSTTGIPCMDEPIAELNLATARNTDEFLNRLVRVPLIQQPGTGYFYGTNTSVLGFVAERVTGKSLAELVSERITEPLGIHGLQYPLPKGVSLLPRVSGRDGALRIAHLGELDIFGQAVPDYDPERELYLGGEGMLATTAGYADFLRMLLAGGILKDHRFLDVETVENLHAPHTQLDSPYGYDGLGLWITGDYMQLNNQGEEGLWVGGGYEGTHFWIDPKRRFVALIMSQIFWIPEAGHGMQNEFRGALYQQFWASEDSET